MHKLQMLTDSVARTLIELSSGIEIESEGMVASQFFFSNPRVRFSRLPAKLGVGNVNTRFVMF